VIRVGDAHYVYYTKVVREKLPQAHRRLYPSGYPLGEIWVAASKDEGKNWKEIGAVLVPGETGAFDSYSVFTPNILKRNDKYYLYYTGVKPTPGRTDGIFENNSTTDVTAIGLAVSDAPDKPFQRISTDPILKTTTDGTSFDSFRVDDAALLIRDFDQDGDADVGLYYKGRNLAHGRRGPGRTKMGLAVADSIEGPYVRQNGGRPLLEKGHEVLIWQEGQSITTLTSIDRKIQRSEDGYQFTPLKVVRNRPTAPGLFREELTAPEAQPMTATWGVCHKNDPNPYLVRFEFRGGEKKDAEKE
jgi:hypothetical protein